ncbi:ComEC/Rec2 family competence protein [Caloramator sp.]|uniref:ComEC/Rec2 family competence protein n=1 Tax=Caloramator sp. TaxID=1871330 RepID=UPI0025B90B21|nr:ComEC/Rec2 family competence protein [Caloramator sp.]
MKRILSCLIIIFTLFFTGCIESNIEQSNNIEKYLKVIVLDVGQGDSILIQTPNRKNILIDAGPNSVRDSFLNKLNKSKVKDIEVLISTHPHEDHIGNMDDVIKNYNINNIFMPKVTTNTKTFINMMEEIKKKNIKIKTAKAGVKFNVDGVEFELLAPNGNYYEELNNYSAVVRVKYKNSAFLFMGDAEKLSEGEILKKGYDVGADVIKLGHHGSSSSSSVQFIKKVNPQYAVISVGKDNSYGHPHRETISLLNKLRIKYFRTDEVGDIIFETDGYNLWTKK